MSDTYDLTIIGAGPGGYVAAVRAAQLGLRVALVEKDAPGGTCLHWGCIPSKHLIHQAESFRTLALMEAAGVGVDRTGFDYAKVQRASRKVVDTLTGGVNSLLRRNDVTYVEGRARLTGRRRVEVEGGPVIDSNNIIIATGSRPMQLSGFMIDERHVLSSDGVLAMTELPDSMLILGAGAIGCEFAFVLNSFGVRVTLVEAMAGILPGEDRDVCAVLERAFTRDGVELVCGMRASGAQRGDDAVSVTLVGEDEERAVTVDRVLVAIGRTPVTDGLGLEEVGVRLDAKGYVETGDFGETDVPGIYAIGDITKSPALAHVASREGQIAVEHIAGRGPEPRRVNADQVPSAVYCEPQVAGFGLREDRALALGIAVKKSVFDYAGAGKTIAIGKSEGLVKLLCDPDTNELLGAQAVGHDATEIIHELLLAKHGELLAEDVASMIHAHPTVSEAVMEAARGVFDRPIHA
ncbi:MAG: dihydrolipoyl dehydrogenase [Proteobacteria bacterium]|nr:dihydrolipoyl dehydrogenase [Pseudomonadota bacterium]